MVYSSRTGASTRQKEDDELSLAEFEVFREHMNADVH